MAESVNTPCTSVADRLFANGGEVGELARSIDWGATPLGPVEAWPQSLQTAVRILLTSRFSMWMGWGEDLVFLYNDAYRRDTLGRKHPWALGRPASQVWAEIWPDVGPRIRTVLETRSATWDEALLLFLERNGYPEETYHTFSYSPLTDDDGAIAGMFCVVMEETERVIGARRLATLRELASALASTSRKAEVLAAVESSLSGNLKDLPFTLLYLFEEGGGSARLVSRTGIPGEHPAAPEVLDLESPASPWPATDVLSGCERRLIEGMGDRFPGLLGAWDRPPERAIVVPVAQQGQEQPAGFLVAGLNPYRPFDEVSAGFVELVAGQIAASLGNAQAYEQERRRAEALAELDRAKTAFFSNVSHEFRTPLTLMLGPLEGLLNGEQALPTAVRDELSLIHRNALRLLRLVNTLLDFARIEAGRTEAVYEPTDLSAYTSELASTFRSAVERAGLRLVVDTPPLPEPVYVDRTMWEKVVLNFLSNAFKFTFEGEIGVHLRWAGDHVELEVQDSGTGIPKEELPHLFERFHRVHGARGRTHEGSGIGLALVQELVRLHHGEISVESTADRGSTFRVRIPTGRAHLPEERIRPSTELAASAAGAVAYVEEALRWLPEASEKDEGGTVGMENTTALPAVPAATRGARILLADDNADMRDYLARLLTQQGYRVEAVANGELALEAAQRELPDLVLTDVMMPRLDGFGLLRALRGDERTRAIPILLLSARAGEESRIEGVEAGADDYLVKPFSARELLARVGAHLELARVRHSAAVRERELRQDAERARAQAEHAGARLREVFQRAPALIATLRGPDHVYETANPLYLQTSGDHILGKPIAEALPELKEQGFVDLLDRVYRTGEPYSANESMVVLDRRVEPVEVFYNFVYQPLFEADGSVSGVLVHAVDVTQQVRARRDVEAARREAEEANLAKSQFLATMSHELRTPLNAIIGYSDLLDAEIAGPLNEGQRKQLDRIAMGARHLLQIIEEILTFSRIEAGREEVQQEQVDLAALVRETAALIEPLAASKQLGFSCRTTDGLVITTDPGKVRQILLNLLSNAVKFTDSGSVDVEAAADHGGVFLRVRDTGIGISSIQMDRIFEPFSQVDQAPSRRIGGTGLGLTVSRQLARLLGGDVHVESALGEGSTFTLRLPSPVRA